MLSSTTHCLDDTPSGAPLSDVAPERCAVILRVLPCQILLLFKMRHLQLTLSIQQSTGTVEGLTKFVDDHDRGNCTPTLADALGVHMQGRAAGLVVQVKLTPSCSLALWRCFLYTPSGCLTLSCLFCCLALALVLLQPLGAVTLGLLHSQTLWRTRWCICAVAPMRAGGRCEISQTNSCTSRAHSSERQL